jgi:hypothetical protein
MFCRLIKCLPVRRKVELFNLFASRWSTSVSSPSVSSPSVGSPSIGSRSLVVATRFLESVSDFSVSFLRLPPEEDEVVFPFRFLPLAFNLNGLSSGEG